jgi:hypothetical protein
LPALTCSTVNGCAVSTGGARLFISSRTVQYYLGKVFTELGISSGGQLHRVLPSDQGWRRP